MTKQKQQKQHKNIRITKEKNMYKIIKNNTFTMASYESKKEAYNAILSIFFEITKNAIANSIEIINAKDRFDFLIDGKLFAFYQIVEFDANADENDKNSDSCWYEERWYDSDLENALLYHEVPVTENTMKLMREKCKHIFDDKSARNEMLEDMAFEIKKARKMQRLQKRMKQQISTYQKSMGILQILLKISVKAVKRRHQC